MAIISSGKNSLFEAGAAVVLSIVLQVLAQPLIARRVQFDVAVLSQKERDGFLERVFKKHCCDEDCHLPGILAVRSWTCVFLVAFSQTDKFPQSV